MGGELLGLLLRLLLLLLLLADFGAGSLLADSGAGSLLLTGSGLDPEASTPVACTGVRPASGSPPNRRISSFRSRTCCLFPAARRRCKRAISTSSSKSSDESIEELHNFLRAPTQGHSWHAKFVVAVLG